ncbi:uncharacterized protein LOC126895751 [Daktulosphaira vitifoliae]|uniref:uncharacterized protein LOC126895751 n=1 Tax=Daktulosphaira vitifoliae TaxID=58002 RepID=UPI0021AAD771|nr:uncharacterized protein LOC126895751 [Daktulosphaira vitifoliae]
MNALEALGQDPNLWGSLLVHLITSKLDPKTLKEWETEAPKTVVPSVATLIDFLDTRFKILEAVESSSLINVRQNNFNSIKRDNVFKREQIRTTAMITNNNVIKCFLCKSDHTIYKCPNFLSLSITERISKVNDLNLCKNCLRQHSSTKCLSRKCIKCDKPHNSLLHLNNFKGNKNHNENNNECHINNSEQQFTSMSANVFRKKSEQVLLSTAVLIAYNRNGEPVICRALLDTGSQSNFITDSMAQTLNLNRRRVNCAITGIQLSTHTASNSVAVKISSRLSNYSSNLECLVLSKLTNNIPLKSIDLDNLKLPANIELADPMFTTPQKIDMILGSGVFFELLRGEQTNRRRD